jgi:hypothetical protein
MLSRNQSCSTAGRNKSVTNSNEHNENNTADFRPVQQSSTNSATACSELNWRTLIWKTKIYCTTTCTSLKIKTRLSRIVVLIEKNSLQSSLLSSFSCHHHYYYHRRGRLFVTTITVLSIKSWQEPCKYITQHKLFLKVIFLLTHVFRFLCHLTTVQLFTFSFPTFSQHCTIC